MHEWKLDELTSFLEQRKTGLVYFYTPMCGTCQLAGRMLSVIEELLEFEMGKMNLNYYPELADKLRIESVPCLLLVRDGKVVDTVYAFRSVPFLLDKIKQVLG